MSDRNKSGISKEWLELSEAAQLLGVHFATLRRWADAGKIDHIRTPSGRRKFHRSVLEAWTGPRRQSTPEQPEASFEPLEIKTLTLARQSAQNLAHQPGNWMEKIKSDQRLAFRYSGQRLLALLMQVTAREDPEPFLAEARRLAKDYGELAIHAGMNSTQLIEAFLYFRRSILVSIHSTAPLSQPQDQEGQRLFERANDFFDMFLMVTLEHFLKLDQQRSSTTDSSPP